ncbi:HET-domain-containing protein [Xylaria telfairii]|nr:HET-domain-containing protein [Xylaria telfairii]
MRFVKTTTLKFNEVSDLEIHKLQGEDEIKYVDVISMNSNVKAKKGFGKFAGACALAKRLGYELIWIDTCCINKSAAAELGEAINLMYRWYEISIVCIAYLQDVTSMPSFKESEWFKRGWTLQELIAPKVVKFYGRDWNFLGDKDGLSCEIISKTGVPADVLGKRKHPYSCSVAQRMSWAAKRTTGRLEDRAYSLMGLFDVNMPMIYGERDRAFLRLQEHIMSKLDEKQVYCGLLAPSPACFARSSDVGFRINQFGLFISLPAIQRGRAGSPGQYAIFLVELPEGDLYARRSTSSGESTFTTTTVTSPPNLYPGFWLRKIAFHYTSISSYEILGRISPEVADRIRLPDQEFGTAGILRLTLSNRVQPAGFGWIKLGFNVENGGDDSAAREILDQVIEMMAILRGSQNQRSRHPIFNNEWTHITPQALSTFPPNSWDSRQQIGNPGHGFDFTFKSPLFEICISVKRAPDMSDVAAGRTGEIWAVDLVAGTPPFTRDDGCCYSCSHVVEVIYYTAGR